MPAPQLMPARFVLFGSTASLCDSNCAFSVLLNHVYVLHTVSKQMSTECYQNAFDFMHTYTFLCVCVCVSTLPNPLS